MPEHIRLTVSKLMRVLVAGGVALAGFAETRAAESDATLPEKPGQASEQAQDSGSEQAKAAKAEEERKKAEEERKKAAQSNEGGGVKGW